MGANPGAAHRRKLVLMSSYVVSQATSPEFIAIAVRAAAEGVPVGAIARAMKLPYDKVLTYLQRAKKLGAINEIPKPDWPANQPVGERRPTAYGQRAGASASPTESRSVHLPHEDVEFLSRHVFRLTNLEAGFLVVLLRTLFAEKEKLHAVIELQRSARPLRPLQEGATDPKMVDVMICKLRKKMGLIDPSFIIRTSWGKGYFLDQYVKDAIYRMLDNGVGDFSHEQHVVTGRGQSPAEAAGPAAARQRSRAAGAVA